jgi:hypothetical protein
MLQGVKIKNSEEIVLTRPYPLNQLEINGEPKLVAASMKK